MNRICYQAICRDQLFLETGLLLGCLGHTLNTRVDRYVNNCNTLNNSPFLAGGGRLRAGVSESDSDLEPLWDSEPEMAGRGLESSESDLPPFCSDCDPESESESVEGFC